VHKLPQETIALRGFFPTTVGLKEDVQKYVRGRDWAILDQEIREETSPGGAIFEELRKYAKFSEIEFIISIRSSLEYPDEDGIWHDDGSRVLAFSLSLTLKNEEVEGGKLEIKKRSNPASVEVLPTPPFGSMIVFATGHQGFEHKINRVTGGERIIIAGWCT
jgi:hypothetical protein